MSETFNVPAMFFDCHMDTTMDEAATFANNTTNATVGIALLQASGTNPPPNDSLELCMGNERLWDMAPAAGKCLRGDTSGVTLTDCDVDKAMDEAARSVTNNVANAIVGIAVLQVSATDPSPDECFEYCMGNERFQDMMPEANKCICGDTLGVILPDRDMDKAIDETVTVANNATYATVGTALLLISGTDARR